MKKKKKSRQETLWIPHDAVASSPGHPFYEELERVLREEEFDSFVESKCSPYYAKKQGRPSIPPGVYFRMLLIGYFERIDSERGICWRCSDSLSLRQFLGLGMEERTPDHSSLSRIRNRLPLEVNESVFGWVLEVLASRGMIDGKTLGVDATTLKANAALRSIVRRDTGESYESYLKELARKSGIEEPSRADIAKLDKKRPKKGSNKEWVNPNEPDAEIMKMKSGGTDMAHKAEHAVDMSGEGAVIAVTLHGGALLHGPEQIADLPVPVAESPGAVRIGHPERSHLVEYLAPNSVFNSLPRQRSSPHLRPDDRLVTIDRVLHHASLGVA